MTGTAASGVEAQVFADLAQHYRELIDRREACPIAELLPRAHQLLASLYAAALSLPDVEGSENPPELRMTQGEWWTVFEALRKTLGSLDRYREVFDPYDRSEGEPVTGSLADDLSDIYRDLREGLDLWAGGYKADAVWAWRDGFQSHWGHHTTGALRAMFVLAYRNDLQAGPGSQDA